MDKITIKKLEVFANHGVYREENILGQKFVFTVVLHLNALKAGITDALEDSVNYGEVCEFIQEYATSCRVKLLERLAEGLAEALLLKYPMVEFVDLEIEKPWAPVRVPLETVSVTISRGWHTAYIALGSNMGDKEAYLDAAVAELEDRDDCQVKKVSDYMISAPYGGVEQDDFLNAVLELRTLLSPKELLIAINEIEEANGRERNIHWGPRTLDIDILLYDDEVIDNEVLHIPHIDMANRDFVLIPMNEIAPWKRHPYLNKTMAQLLEELNNR